MPRPFDLRRRSVLARSVVFAVGLLVVEPAAAGSSPPGAPAPQDRAVAQALFDEGRELMRSGRAAEACPRFEESDRLEPGVGTRFHLATCYEALGRLASAHALFREVAAESKARGQADRARLARQRADVLEPRLSRLAIAVPFASAQLRVERDGTPIGSAQWGLAVPVDPGRHHVSASAPGRKPWSTDIVVAADAAFTHVEVPPLADVEQPFFAPTSRKIGLAALGVGVGSLALGGVFAGQALSKKEASNRAGCSEDACPTPAGVALRREALAAGNRATWAFSAGIVSLGAAAALFWLVPTGEDDAELLVTPVADRESASVFVNGSF